MTEKSRVSILIPCYNAERWIAEAIESALAQTWTNNEIIVMDDGSTDGSLDVIKRYGRHIHWRSGQNRGGNWTRNKLLQFASSEWLQYLDADDYLKETKIEGQMEFILANPSTDVVFGPVTVEHWTERGGRQEVSDIPSIEDHWILLASWRLPQTGSPLWRREAIMAVGGWNVAQSCCQEHELYLRLLMGRRRFSYCPSNGAVYRLWSSDTVCTRNIPEVCRRRLEI